MNQLNCEYVLEVYPDVLNGSAPAQTAATVRAHLAGCAECRAITALLAQLHGSKVAVPAGLHERVMAARGNATTRRWAGLRYYAAAATVAAAMIGGSLLLRADREPAPPPAALGFVTVEDAMVSGAASLNDLTIEELEQLLGEIES